MCLIAYAWNAHPAFPLVVAANRDEFHARPTAPLGVWPGNPAIVGGQDLQAGGGWLALRRERPGLAAVTNVREPLPPGFLQSRGALVAGFLRGRESAAGYAELRRADGDEYGPFNLLLWDGEDLVLATNREQPRWENAQAGVHGLSNGRLENHWPKTARVCAALEGWLAVQSGEPAIGSLDAEPLFAALGDEQPTDDQMLPDTGIGLERERALSSPFIRLPRYGTRASTVVMVARNGARLIVERSYDEDGQPVGDRRESWG